ncbi:MAG TPA: hypothetical protein VM869_16650, partial [Enhygromyxa sp.]|nr:hypothetical protein [Enhygromyxa sp.]
LNGWDCGLFGGGGTLSCNADCTLDTSGCSECGNGMLERGEVCEGNNFAGATCQTQGFSGGSLFCFECDFLSTANCCNNSGGSCNPLSPGGCCGNSVCIGGMCL